MPTSAEKGPIVAGKSATATAEKPSFNPVNEDESSDEDEVMFLATNRSTTHTNKL